MLTCYNTRNDTWTGPAQHRNLVQSAIDQATEKGLDTIGAIVTHFRNVLGGTSFKSVHVSTEVSSESGRNTAYILMSGIPAQMPSIKLDWFENDQSRYTYCDGDGPGSLVDLVLGQHDTVYPRKSTGLWVAAESGAGLRAKLPGSGSTSEG